MASIASRQGWRALLTRPREEADTLVAALAARQIGALVEPMMEVHFRSAVLDLAGVQAVLCTSANGVRALARTSGERDLPLLAVGDATAARARALGFTKVESAAGNAADLVQLATDRLRPRDGTLLHVCGKDVTGDLVGALRARGFAVERSILYEARPIAAMSDAVREALRHGEIDFALFFSPRTALIFTRLADAAGLSHTCETIIALSISAAADAALGATVWRARRIAQRPDQAALLGLLDQLIVECGCG